MTDTTTGVSTFGASETAENRVQFDVLVAPDYVLIEVASLVEILSLANRVSVPSKFSWTFRSKTGGLVRSRTGAILETSRVTNKPDADYLFVIGNTDPDNPALSVGRIVSDYTYRGAQVFLLAEAASRYIGEHGDKGLIHTTHWENTMMLRERELKFDALSLIAVENGQIVTCAGMEATTDIALSVLGRHVSSAAKRTIADIMLHERIRDFSTPQPFTGMAGSFTGDRDLDHCIDLMQANMEDPLPISDLVGQLGISSRSLERKFKSHLNSTPNTYYRELRMNRASNLLANTTMSVREVGMACGFPNGFSSLYKSFFGITPHALRQKLRQGVKSVRR